MLALHPPEKSYGRAFTAIGSDDTNAHEPELVMRPISLGGVHRSPSVIESEISALNA